MAWCTYTIWVLNHQGQWVLLFNFLLAHVILCSSQQWTLCHTFKITLTQLSISETVGIWLHMLDTWCWWDIRRLLACIGAWYMGRMGWLESLGKWWLHLQNGGSSSWAGAYTINFCEITAVEERCIAGCSARCVLYIESRLHNDYCTVVLHKVEHVPALHCLNWVIWKQWGWLEGFVGGVV